MMVRSHHPSRAKLLFMHVQELDSEAERAQYLEAACADDPQLRQLVDELLVAASRTGPLDRVIPDLKPTPRPLDDLTLKEIGAYTLKEKIGEGGMGVVYAARQNLPIRRMVALKLIKPGMDSRQVVARFEAERQALAMMNHPNIAKVLDAGTTVTGLPYFVMELVKGVPITEYCDRHRLSLRERLELFEKVCDSVHHAHQKGIIHRDLKPSNVLVELDNVRAVPKVIDFGVAKAAQQPLTENSVYTHMTQMVGTPLYMSPEQAQLNSMDVDTRSDIYSLGVLLYELLTGSTPFDREKLRQAGFDEMRRIIREDQPPRPSWRVSTLKQGGESSTANRQQIDQRHLSLALQSELDWIVMKALEKDRTRRYESASAFAADVQRYLDGEAVHACPPTLKYRLAKIAKRHKGILTGAALVLLTAIAGTAASLWYANTAARAVVAANEARAISEDQTEIAKQAATAAQASQQREAIARARATAALYVSDTRLAASYIQSGFHADALDSLARQIFCSPKSTSMPWEWYYLLGQANETQQSWIAHLSDISEIAWSSDGSRLASVSNDGSSCIWNPQTGEQTKRFHVGNTIKCCVSWNSSSKRLAWGSADSDSSMYIWDEATDAVERVPMNTESVWTVKWSRDGTRLLSGSMGKRKANRDERNLFLWENINGVWKNPTGVKVPGSITSAQWNFDESLIATVTLNSIRFYDAKTMELVHEISNVRALKGAFHPTKNWFSYVTRDSQCVVFDTRNYEETARFDAHRNVVRNVAWSPNGAWIATCGDDGVVCVSDTKNWALVRSFRGHAGRVASIAWHPDSTQLASAGVDARINVWTLEQRRPFSEFHTNLDGKEPFVWTADNLIRTVSPEVVDREPHSLRTVRKFNLDDHSDWRLAGKGVAYRAASNDSDKTEVIVLHSPERRFDVPASTSCFSASPDGMTIAFSQPDKFGDHRAVCYAVQSSQFTDLGTEKLRCRMTCFSPDGKKIAVVGGGLVSDDGTPRHAGWLHLFDTSTGRPIKRVRVGSARVLAEAASWSADSSRIVAASEDGFCEVYDATDLKSVVRKYIHFDAVHSLSWHPDSSRIASGGEDEKILVWDSRSGEVLLNIPMDDAVVHVEWSPDGTMLAAKSSRGLIRIWDASSGRRFAQSTSFQNRVILRAENEANSAISATDWLKASQIAREVIDYGTDELAWHVFLGKMSLALGRHADYAESCQRTLHKFRMSATPVEASAITWLCAMGPNSLADYDPVIGLARQLVQSDPENQQFSLILGALLARAGQFEAANRQLCESLKLKNDPVKVSRAYDHFLLAIIKYHSKDVEEAARQLELANAISKRELATDCPWQRRLQLQLFRAEVENLLDKSKGSKGF